MKKENIKLGYEVDTGKEVGISPSHLIVTGVTQLSGKTTTLEALIKRGGTKAVVFKTKVGETGFTEGTIMKYCGQHGATEQEIVQVQNHILVEML